MGTRDGRQRQGGGGNNSINAVFYADAYHPIQTGSIDGTDILPHDNAVYRALLCSNAGLYDPFGDPKAIGDPYRTLFVGRLSRLTTENTLRAEMSKYGRVKSLRLVRDIVTGASCGYAFVEFETDREMRWAYKDAHHTLLDDSEIIVDYNRQRLMPGWIPRRLGGGLGGKKESGQLRFGGRERPFRAPLRPVPFDDLKRLGMPPPPDGRYKSRFDVPSPPRRERSGSESDGLSYGRGKHYRHSRTRESSVSRGRSSDGYRRSVDREESSRKLHKGRRNGNDESYGRGKDLHLRESSESRARSPDRDRRSVDRVESSRPHKRRRNGDDDDYYGHDKHLHSRESSVRRVRSPDRLRRSLDREVSRKQHKRRRNGDDSSREHDIHDNRDDRRRGISHQDELRSASRNRSSDEMISMESEEYRHGRSKHSHRYDRWSPDRDEHD